MKLRKNKPMKESYSDIWSDNAWDAYDIAMEYLGAEGLCEALAKAMGTDALASNLQYIFRVNEIPFMEDDEEFDECVSESISLKENEMDDWYESIPKQLWDVTKEMEKLGWDSVGYVGQGVEYALGQEDPNRPELNYEITVDITHPDFNSDPDSIYVGKWIDIYDYDKMKNLPSFPNTSGVTEFRTPQDVRKFTQWFRRLGTSFSTKESVRKDKKQTIKELLYKYNPTKDSRYMQQDLRGIYVGDDVSELDEELTREGYFVAQSGHCLSPKSCDYKTWSNERFVITVYYNRETHIVDTIYVEDMDQ
jgi:hypothetical protein